MKIGKIKIPQTVLHQPGDIVDPEIFFGDTLDLAKYDDITSIESWHIYGHRTKDYLYVRNEITIISATTGFANLSTDEKELASLYFAVAKTDRDTVHTDDEQQGNWKTFVSNAVACRTKRWEESKSYISYNLSIADSIDLAKSADSLSHEYLLYGIESNANDGVDGIFDYIEGTSGYVTGGYPDKAYWSQADQDKIIDVLKNGNY